MPLKEKFNIPQLGNERAPETIKPGNKNAPSVMELEATYNLDIEDRNYFAAMGRGRNAPRVASLPKENRCPDSPLNDLNEKSKPPEISPEEMQYLEKMVLDLEEEKKKIEYTKAGRGRGPHQVRKYISRPSIVVKKRNPALPRSTLFSCFKRGPVTTRSRSKFYLLLWNTGIWQRTWTRAE